MASTTVIVNVVAEVAVAKSACSSEECLKFSREPAGNA